VDISQTAADAVFQGDRLAPVLDLLDTARRSGRLVTQNFGLAIGYNALAVPLAVAGLVTPLVAAVCMSGSSLLVTGNALRLALRRE
jgi:Cu2+-exporting ATPase